MSDFENGNGESGDKSNGIKDIPQRELSLGEDSEKTVANEKTVESKKVTKIEDLSETKKTSEEKQASETEKQAGDKIKMWPGLRSEDVERYRKLRQEQQEEAVAENADKKAEKVIVTVSDDVWKEKMAAAERRARTGASGKKGETAALKTRKKEKIEQKEAQAVVEEPAAAMETVEASKPERSIRDLSKLEEKPSRKRRETYRVKTQTLYKILGVLCVILGIALVGQEYYMSVTFEKGELAQLAEGKTQQRRRFLTEAVVETEVLEETELSSEAVTESGLVIDAATGEVVLEETELAGETLPAEPVMAKTVVETSESVNLKNQLIGVLPGIMPPGQTSAELIEQADLLAAMYDYDAATELLKNCRSYEQDEKMQAAVAGYQSSKAACVEYPVDQVTHVFFHTLIKDAAKAFDGDQYEAGYNQYMVTIDEFNSIIQQMYEKGYVMVTLEDMATKTVREDGTVLMERGKILLPEGKIPFVLSQDDVSYYHYMDGDGYAQKLIIDENGDVKNTYIEEDGSISVGDYDMIPLIDTFVDAHPDFSYRGAKGYIALTGYDGILGYRTDICYKTRENLTSYQAQFFEENPDFSAADFERECEESKKVAEALKADGWLFASHTWGHVGLGSGSTTFEQFKTDTDKWEERVEPLIGETDTIIYAFGGDIGGAEEYAGERFEYLKKVGFDYFCGVDSAVYWIQLRDNYIRQARRNIDGYRMYYNPDMLSDLFDVDLAWDPLRPESVPPI